MRQVSTISTAMLADVIERTLIVMREQKDDNGEAFAEGNSDLYSNLQSVLVAVNMAVVSDDDIVFPHNPDADQS